MNKSNWGIRFHEFLKNTFLRAFEFVDSKIPHTFTLPNCNTFVNIKVYGLDAP